MVNVEDTMSGQPLAQRPEWSHRVGRLTGWPPLAQNYAHVVAQLEAKTDAGDLPAWCLAQIEAAERVRQLYEGDLKGAQRDWAILVDPSRTDDEPSYHLSLLAEAAKVDAEPLSTPAGVPNASNRLTQQSIDEEWARLAAILWPGMDPFAALQANIGLAAQILADAEADDPNLLAGAQAWLDAMAALTVKVARDRKIAVFVAAWRVAIATQTLHDSVAEVAARVEVDDTEPAVLARQRLLTAPMDILAIADAGVVALARSLTDPTDQAGEAHVLITQPLVEAVFVGRRMTDDESILIMGDDPDAAYGTLEAIIRVACEVDLTTRRPLIAAIALDRWWTSLTG